MPRSGEGARRTLILRQCRQRLRLGQIKRVEVCDLVAKILGRRRPHLKADQYEMLAEFAGMPYSEAVLVSVARANAPSLPRARPKTTRTSSIPFVVTDGFLASYEWRKLRMVVLKKRGARCECCGSTPADGVRMHVDHIKPRRKFPELALTESNLQILCEVCNHGKGSWDQTDWRADVPQPGESSKDSPVPGTVTATSKDCSALRPRLVRRS